VIFSIFRRPQPKPVSLTGARSTLTASHRSRDSGDVHQHTWAITVWVPSQLPWGPQNALNVQAHLETWIAQHSGKCLPDRIAWAEDMARNIAEHFSQDVGREEYTPMFEPQAVEIFREKEGLLALWVPA